jgi:hypothetical protein
MVIWSAAHGEQKKAALPLRGEYYESLFGFDTFGFEGFGFDIFEFEISTPFGCDRHMLDMKTP